MITGEDYNISPLSVSQQVSKVKAVNRTSSGISRYFDLTDPTGKYSSTNLFATDGILYKDEYVSSTRFSYNNKTDIEGIIYNDIFDILDKSEIKHFYYSNYIVYVTSSLNIVWNTVSTDTGSSTGYVGDASDGTIYKLGSFTATDLKYYKPGALVRFEAPAGYYFDTLNANTLVLGTGTASGASNYIWSEVVSVVDDGTAAGDGILSTGFGPVTMNKEIPIGAVITQIIPQWRTTIDSSTITTMIDLIFSNKPFGLRYDIPTQAWQIVFESNLDAYSAFSLGKQGDTTNKQQDASWILLFTTDNEYYTVQSRELRYVFESDAEIEFYFDKSNKIYDTKSNVVVKDLITVLSINTTPVAPYTTPFTRDFKWDIISEYAGIDGYIDGKKIIISFADADSNGAVDDPEEFSNIIGATPQYIVQEKYLISSGQEDYRYVNNSNEVVKILASESLVGSKINYTAGQYFYFVDTKVVKKLNTTRDTLVPSLDYKVYVGRSNLKFQYTHSADYESRIDPGASNIIDVFVLTKTYDTTFRQWLAGADIDRPLPPSSDELYNTLAPSLNLIKSISDEVVYHPVNYKVLFGSTAAENLQASFKVTKTPGQVVSDNDIKARVVYAINQFFALENWDFGDTFYFTELSAYVMNQLAPDIANFVIVPRQSGLNFGSLFEIKSGSDQLFVNGATVDDIEIITGITSSNIKSVSGTSTTSTVSITSSQYGSI
jgi:hypothetical protein